MVLFPIVHWHRYDVSFLVIPLELMYCRCLWSRIVWIGNCLGSLRMSLGGGGWCGWGGVDLGDELEDRVVWGECCDLI